MHGADRVVRFLVGVARKLAPMATSRPLALNGGPGFAYTGETIVHVVGALDIRDGRIRRVDLPVAPSKLPRTFRPDTAGAG